MSKSHCTTETPKRLISIGKIIVTNANICAGAVENGIPNQSSAKNGPISKYTSLKLSPTIRSGNRPTKT